jgi:hypothetical protein
MDWQQLIPAPDSIPAAWGVFESLDLLLFVAHILAVNVVVGGTLITLYSRLTGGSGDGYGSQLSCASEAVGNKIPVMFAISVTMGVAPLLFVQVLYGHLLYSSSVLMALFWILVIPGLIVGYYGAYVYRYQQSSRPVLANAALIVTGLIVLYIAFMFVNNMTLMLNPQKWIAYFDNRDGTILNLDDPTVYSRYAHFVVASIAVASLFSAIVWRFRKQHSSSEEKGCLRHFGYATMVQVMVGFWLLMSLPRQHMLLFMGGDGLMTGLLTAILLLAMVLIMLAMRGKLWATVAALVTTVVVMATMRALLRAAYLSEFFSVTDLEVAGQYDVLAVFVVVLLAGGGACYYMARQAIAAWRRRVSQ